MASLARPLRQALSATTRAGPSLLSSTASRPAPARSTLLQNSAKAAAFHASSRRCLLPPLPQTVEGTVNDPAPIPPTSPAHGSYHWTSERLLAAGLVPLTVAPFAAGSLNPTMDAVLISALLLHSHLGLQVAIVDYLPKRRVPKSRMAAMWALNIATIVAGIGLYEFETNDVGLTEGIKRVWKA
ncbi:hypothetical protein GGTG_00374 [Gaeumannomyces tritici R3-111a-1]|uniref:Succinate dehydrogenase [ubiquinone] cytochrome b small subunit n=1 Tax=Gaeumannomyces tritici (strain R3-111a-1) TaxID=644352 RepID=J3NGI4_GAET3|nr:hypothetical protein GGTG_00374 [Gaeumannomyces tritici R3-111a-1]EJT80374.1 hypothetical protein GGTG_00374 [Gaeumannomyces tritici R3-111a-1]